MIHLLATPMEVRRESHDQTPNRIKHDPEGTWDFGGSLNPLIALSNTDRYTGGSLELHIHYRIKAGWDVDSCAVFQCLTPTNVALRGVVNPIGGDVGHLGVSECGGQNDQPSVRVFVAEPTQDVHDVEILKARVYSPVGQVGWLRRLDDCHSLLAHSARTGVPTFTGSSEFLVLPLFGWDIPDGLPDDGKRHAPAIGRGDQRTGEVVQAGPKVVEEISCDEWNLRSGASVKTRCHWFWLCWTVWRAAYGWESTKDCTSVSSLLRWPSAQLAFSVYEGTTRLTV